MCKVYIVSVAPEHFIVCSRTPVRRLGFMTTHGTWGFPPPRARPRIFEACYGCSCFPRWGIFPIFKKRSGCFSQVGEFYLKAPWLFLPLSPFIHSCSSMMDYEPDQGEPGTCIGCGATGDAFSQCLSCGAPVEPDDGSWHYAFGWVEGARPGM